MNKSELEARRLADSRLGDCQAANMRHYEEMSEIARALGIYVGHEAWWDIPRAAQLLRVMDKIRTLKEKK